MFRYWVKFDNYSQVSKNHNIFKLLNKILVLLPYPAYTVEYKHAIVSQYYTWVVFKCMQPKMAIPVASWVQFEKYQGYSFGTNSLSED